MNRPSNKVSFANLSQEQLMTKARTWNDARIIRAALGLDDYKMIGSEGQIVNLATGAAYECEDVRRWEALPGTVVYVGCDCADETDRLSPMRSAMDAAGCGTPCYCKHHYLRLLFTGAKLRVGNLRIRSKR